MSTFDTPIHLTAGGVILASLMLQRAARFLGQSQVVGEILAGLVVGIALNSFGEALGGTPGELARSTAVALDDLGTVGLVFVVLNALFLAPPTSKASDKSTDLRAVLVVVLANFLPALLAGGWLATRYVSAHALSATPAFVLLVGAAMSISAVPVLARILVELDLATSRVGGLAFRAACWTDVLGWMLVGLALSLHQGKDAGYFAATRVSLVVAIFAAMWIVRRLIDWYRPSSTTSNQIVLVNLLFAAGLTHLASLHLVFGAFLVGSVFSANNSIREQWLQNTGWITDRFFCPLFFAIAGMKLLSSGGVSAQELGWGAAFLLACILTKLVPLNIAGRYLGLSSSESALLGLTLNTRGLMELVILSVGLNAGILSPVQCSIFVIVAVVTTVMSTPLCRLVQRRLDPVLA